MASRNKKYIRIVDANLNRAREGLRVIEDTARFVYDNAVLYKKVRSLRHMLDEITRSIYPELVAQRNSYCDSGRTIPEGKRESVNAIVAANFRRVEESVRVLEEYSRLIVPQAGSVLKHIRFSTYILEKKFIMLL